MYSLVVLVLIIVVVEVDEIRFYIFKKKEMTIIWNRYNTMNWDNPGIMAPRNVWPSVAPYAWRSNRSGIVNMNARPMYSRNIQPNYNVSYSRGRYVPQYVGRYANRGNYWNGYNTASLNTTSSTTPAQSNYNYQDAYRRLAQDSMAWFNNPNQSRDVMNYYNSIRNNPEAVAWTRRMLNGTEPRSIDYDIPNIDQYGNYNRINLNDPNNPEVISRFQTKAGRARMNSR